MGKKQEIEKIANLGYIYILIKVHKYEKFYNLSFTPFVIKCSSTEEKIE
jgi:hypothetical protein